MKKYILSIITLVIVFFACTSDNSNEPTAIDTFHQDYYTVNILPSIQNFKLSLENQINLIETFKTDTSQDNFENLKTQWLLCATNFSKISVYNIVPVKALFYDILIYNFSITPSKIEENILEQTTYNSDYFSSQSTVTKGLATLEYLLYNNQDTDTALNLLQQDSFRINYMLGVTEDALLNTNALLDFWESGYKETFINATDVSCTENARCLAFNQLINVIDVIRVTKLGKPAGLESSSSPAVESLEAFRSENSLQLLKSSLEEIQYAYNNSNVNFAAIVDEIANSSEVTEAINTSFNQVFSIINAIDSSLYTAILNDDPNVELLYNSLFDLVKYFSVDASSILSVNVLPTDNDGD